jgi:cobalt-zinc-cadmium efflux system membrane fusion protein
MNLKSTNARRLLVALIVIAVVAVVAWWSTRSKAASSAAQAAPRPILTHDGIRIVVPEDSPLRASMRIETVATSRVEVPFALPAVVEADPAKLYKALPPLAGRITRLGRNIGDRVAVGDELYALESPDLVQAVSDAEKAKAAVALAQAALDRQRALGTSEIASRRDIEQAESDFAQARSEQGRADTRLAQLGAGRQTAIDGRALSVRSPIAGTVVDQNATAGAYWNDLTAPLMTVADLSSVFVSASADEHDLAQLFAGQSVQVGLDAYPGDVFAAKVRSIGPLLDSDTRRVKVRMLFANADGRMKPGMFATARFAGTAHDGLLVPITAVVQSGFDSRVFVEVQPWVFEPRVVQLGQRVGPGIEILKGLAPDTRVVVRDGVLLND